MKMIGIKLADGSFYPIMEEGKPCRKNLGLTTVKDNQTRVLVDLYRSKTGSMEDAEYVDSLQIDNLVEHPNGEANISLNIALDENNKLSADMNDPETGGTSNSNITLVSRTVEERLEPTNYELIKDSVEDVPFEDAVETDELEDSFDIPEESAAEEPVKEETEIEPEKEKSNTGAMVAGGIVAGGGLLAAAALLNKKNKEKEEAELQETSANDEFVPEETEDSIEAFAEDSSSDKTIEGSMEDIESDAASDDVFVDSASDMDFADESIDETTDFSENETADFSIPDDTLGDKEDSSFEEISESAEGDDVLADLPDFEETEAGTEVETESEQTSEMEASSFGIADFADDTVIDDSVEETEQIQDSADEDFDKTVVEDFSVEEPLINDNMFEEEVFENTDTVSDSDSEEFSLPDDLVSQETVVSEDVTSEELTADELANQNDDDFDLDLPDFPETDNESTENLDDISSNETFFDSIAEPEDANMNNNLVNDNTPSNGINFSGLYDQETVEGDSSLQEDDVQKKTKAPVIICIICAIICIIATLLILFVVPSKYNLLTSRNSKTTEEVQIVEEVKPEEVPPVEEVVPEAKEDEVVVVTEPEQVVPEAPVEPEVKPQNITYKIRWGDTLWDIADTYYKNPWRYRKIARFNNIKNPDYIISGTTIEIPVE